MCQPSDDHEARVRIAQRLLDETERARREENELNATHSEPEKKPGFWSVLGNAIGEAIGQAKFGQ